MKKQLLTLLLIPSFFLGGCSDQKGYIVIKNESSVPVTNVTVNYISPRKSYVLGTIYPKSLYKYAINYDHNETSIHVSYFDKNQKKIDKVAIGYSTIQDKESIELIIK